MADTNVNEKYKDRLFRDIFGSEERKHYTLDLYNAINNTSYTDPEEIELTTIDDVLYLGRKNDISFLIATNMSLFEHQSSPNPNLPLRGLIYFGRLYDKYLAEHALNKKLYSSTSISLPTPQYVVFYNGLKESDDRSVLRLTDAFEQPEASCLEVKVLMLNINYGRNKELMDKCTALNGYAYLISRIRHHSGTMDLEPAVRLAVNECIKDDILSDYLRSHKAEVIGMCLTEFSDEFIHDVFYDEGHAEGHAEGLAEGRAEGLAEGRAEGRVEGRAEGRVEGRAEGRVEGMDSINALNKVLLDSSRIDDLKRATEDSDYQQQLLEELVYQQQA